MTEEKTTPEVKPKKTLQTIPEEMRKKIDSLNMRARAHGVNMIPGEPVIVTVEKLIDRLDAYRDTPAMKGRIIIE